MARFQQALSAQDDDSSHDELDGKGGCILRTLRHLRKATWGGGTQRGKSDDDDDHDDDCLFTSLIDFREEIKAAEARMMSAHSAYESLASLTAPNSALVALENVRKLLLGISADDVGPLFDAIEKTHELLNDVESSLNDCARSIDGGLMSTLENMAFTGIPLEMVDGIIADWNALARKHGISVSGSSHYGNFLCRGMFYQSSLAAIFSTKLSHVDAGGAGRERRSNKTLTRGKGNGKYCASGLFACMSSVIGRSQRSRHEALSIRVEYTAFPRARWLHLARSAE